MKRSRLKPMSAKRVAAKDERNEIRAAVFARDDYRCVLDRSTHPRVPPCAGILTVHHLRKASAGGPFTMENLVTCCWDHNRWIEDEPLLATELGLVRR